MSKEVNQEKVEIGKKSKHSPDPYLIEATTNMSEATKGRKNNSSTYENL